MPRLTLPVVAFVGLLALAFGPRPASAESRVGVAAVDITPDYPIRLSGFGFRRTESKGVTQRIWAKAIAFAGETGDGPPAVIVTVDNLGVPLSMTREVAERLQKKAKLSPQRFAVTASHTHTAPMLKGVAPTLFGQPIPPDHQGRIDKYTRQLTDWIEQAALKALADMKPARVEFGVGTADLAANRRQPGGPVDHDLPVLVVRDAGSGKLRAVYASYACHCVTLSNNKVSGDWAGYLQEAVEKNHPGAIALTSIGCGGDANPKSGVTGDKADVAAAQGKQLAAEIDRLLNRPLKPITAPVATKTGEVELLFDTHPTREQWQEKARRDDAVGYHAKVNLAKLDRGEKLQTKLPYPVQTWTFGDELAMVFLPGEVVVDFSLRLKKEYDRGRLWVNAYSNDAPCYIPSERVLKEGGYEGEGAMVYYDRPTKFAPGLEEKIVGEVRRQLPETFRAPRGTEGVPPKSPEASRQSIRTKPGLEVELVAAEPLIQSPVAIDWSADGRMWVCEMFDYPAGVDGNFQPGGRVKVLHDADGDGKYDEARVFLDGISFPTGITCWGRGVFVCSAPDILYAEDTDGDGKADRVEKLFTGFSTDNYQARVNGLALGLDNWIHGANGLLGGVITNVRTGEKTDIRNRDFRFKPPNGPFETVTGYTQQGRVRNDWGGWFGCDNSTPLMHYPYEERYLRRNPHAPSTSPIVRLAGSGFDGGR
ncbi:MAG TPA: neutral/alkaline non-lysosomal ceramidase N-terminal domain-containing protein, partial [Tepidisphaeraceae bacterium]|nr:neutral/alkaline non-lysosomal ceramidase N-terminal domain-containing protein [Tepidisphaeraceae bacterium]